MDEIEAEMAAAALEDLAGGRFMLHQSTAARVARRAVAAAVDAERAETLIVAEQVLGPVAAGHLAEALAEIGARVAASTTPTDAEAET